MATMPRRVTAMAAAASRRGSAGASKANFDKPIDDEIPF